MTHPTTLADQWQQHLQTLPIDATAEQVRMCGNSVCPPIAAALVRANYRETDAVRQAA